MRQRYRAWRYRRAILKFFAEELDPMTVARLLIMADNSTVFTMSLLSAKNSTEYRQKLGFQP